MPNYNFDKPFNRKGTNSLKFDALAQFYGREDVNALWVADMDFEVCPDIQQAIEEYISVKNYGYGATQPEFWQSIIDWQRNEHGLEVTREELSFIPGVVKGIILALTYFTNRGDKVVIQPPVYHMFRFCIEGAKRTVIDNPLIPAADGYAKMDFDGLEKIFIEQQPKAMVLCNPHNPIGICWDKETLTRLAKLCKQYNVLVISDEIHADLDIFGHNTVPFLASCQEAQEVGIAFGAPSKTFSIPGIISAWCVIKNKSRRDFFEWLEHTELSECMAIAEVATTAAYQKGKPWLTEVKSYIESNVIAVEEFLAANIPSVKAVRPQASFLVWLDCRELGMSPKALEEFFLDKAHLALNAGYSFGRGGEGFMRINVATSKEYLIQSLQQLADAVKAL